MKEILFNALKSKGFLASAANDLSNMLEKAVLRCDKNPSKQDISDLISALETLKETL